MTLRASLKRSEISSMPFPSLAAKPLGDLPRGLAARYECESCGERQVYGSDELLMYIL
jgi:hypothetical protein